MTFQPVTHGGTRYSPFQDGIPFILTDSDRSRIALYQAQAIAAVRKQNERDANQALAAWRGQMHRYGDGA